MSIMVVPTYNYTHLENSEYGSCWADDMFDEEDKCWVLTPGGEHTGICPPNCGGSQ